MASTEPALDDVSFEELERVDGHEATFTGTHDGDELTLTYTVESAVDADGTVVHAPGDDALEDVLVRPDTYDFETDADETVRFTATDDDGEDLFLVYAFAAAEDADENAVDLRVDSDA